MPAKVRLVVLVDAENKKTIQDHLRSCGVSMGSFFDGLLSIIAADIKQQPICLDKPAKDWTLEEFGKLMKFWVGKGSQ